MADRVKGIVVEIGGETTGLSKALKGVNKEINTTQSQLKDVEKLLKLDPKNTELLEQKQRLLGQAVQETKGKLDTLKEAEKSVQDQFAAGKISQEQYEGLQREIESTEQKLKSLETQAQSSSVMLQKVSTVSGEIASGAGKVAGAMMPATLDIGALGRAAFSAASDVAESQNKVDVAFGGSADAVKSFADTALENYGMAKGTALDMAALFGDMGTSMGLGQDEAAQMSTSLVGLAGDLASFKNIGTDQAMTALNGVFTGETESLKTLGVVMTQTNLDAFAMANGYGKTTEKMTEAEKVQLRYAYVMNATQNAQGDFANTSDGAANSLRIMQESTKEATAELGTALLPVITPIIQKITELIQQFAGMDEGQKGLLVTVLAVIAAIGPVAGLIGGIATAVGGVTAVIGAVSGGIAIFTGAATTGSAAAQAIAGAIGLITSPVFLVLAAVVALIAVFALFGDQIQEKLAQVDEFMQGVFSTDWTTIFGSVLGEPLNAFFAVFSGVWDSIVGVLNGVIDIVRGVFTGDWDRAWNGVLEVFGGIFGGLEALVKAPINGVIGLLNSAIGAVNKLIGGFNSIGFDMPDWLGGKSWHPSLPTIGKIPYLANGGTLTRGSAVVGEAGPELLSLVNGGARVTPLTGAQKAAAGATFGNITCNVYAADVQNVDQLADRVADKINFSVRQKAEVW